MLQLGGRRLVRQARQTTTAGAVAVLCAYMQEMANIYDILGFPSSLYSVSHNERMSQGRKEGSKECFNILSDLSANNAAVAFHSSTEPEI